MYWLVSYPRSGNTFVRYCVEYISKQPTVDWPAICERVADMNVNLSADPIMFKSHRYTGTNVGIEAPSKMIALVRDYKECIPRHFKEQSKFKNLFDMFVAETVGTKNETGADYISILQAYEERKGPKYLLHYEDLILKPKETIKNLAKFLELENKYLDEVLNNYEKHRGMGLKSYHARSFTKGNDIKFHQKSIDKNTLQKMTTYLRQTYPQLFKTYLRRYQ